MAIDTTRIRQVIAEQTEKALFSGVVLIQEKGEIVFSGGYALANKASAIPNTVDTRFGIASGCKIFTAVSVCQLIEKGLISFDTLLKDCLDVSFPKFDPQITVHHLLTHSSGIPDYFDEEFMEDEEFEELWRARPMYTIRTPRDFLPMFQHQRMKFAPGKRFSYSNAGFILLGLIVEQQAGIGFTEYVERNIFAPCGMTDSGYFAMDRLPERTANGYIYDESDDSWRTNIYAVPIIGGPDGGAFTTAPDIVKFWTSLFDYQLLGKALTERFLTPQIMVNGSESVKDKRYGYGVWITMKEDAVWEYYITGGDPGVKFFSAVYPQQNALITVIRNTDRSFRSLCDEIESIVVDA